jgi:hypothetical protein
MKKMRPIQLIGFVGLVSLVSINGLLAGTEWKETEISKDIRMNYKPNIIPPGPDVATDIAAFSGRWEGKMDSYKVEWILVVEEITPKKAKVIFGWNGFPTTSPVVGAATNDSQRLQGEVIPGSKPRLKISTGDVRLTFEPGNSPGTLNGVREFKGRTAGEMVLHKVE